MNKTMQYRLGFIGFCVVVILSSCCKDSASEYNLEGNWTVEEYRWYTYWSQKKGRLGEVTDSISRMQKILNGKLFDTIYSVTTIRLPISVSNDRNVFIINKFDFSFGSSSYIYTKHLMLHVIPTDSTIVNYSESKDYFLRGNVIQMLGHNYTIKSYSSNRIELETNFKTNERIQFNPNDPRSLYYDIDSLYYERFVLVKK